jgi:ABC-type Fe3+/spermidine/putrescine transport system ATPase subunit
MPQPVLEFRSVSKSFKNVRALYGVSFAVSPGEIFTLLGPSGCGKTTTLRLAAGLEEPDAGEICLNGAVVAAPGKGLFIPPEKRHLGMVFQSYAIWPHLTVFENVAFPLRINRRSFAEIHSRVSKILDTVGLGGFEQRGATELSGGQQQRVALARALVSEPAILLLDEPLSNLDAKLREQMRLEIRALQKTLQLTALYVTHDQAEAMTLSDRIAVVRGGRFEQVGTPAEVYDSPETSFVAEFLGRTVSFEGKLMKNGSGCWIELHNNAGRLSLPATLTVSFGGGETVRLIARPEDFEILPEHVANPAHLTGRIEQVAYLGDRFEYQVNSGGISFALASSKRHRYEAGSSIRISLDPERVKLERL